MVTRFTILTAAVLLCCGSAHAQARMNVFPLPALGMTSPLGIPNAPVGHTGIPMGAIELATPGLSPTTSGASPIIGAICGGASSPSPLGMGNPLTGASAGMAGLTTGASAGAGSSMPGLSGMMLFDGGGMATSAPGTCVASATAFPPMAGSMGPGSSVGMVGIPLGSTELGGGGLSPPSVALSPDPSAPAVSSFTPLTTTASNSSTVVSISPSVAPCPVTQTGVPIAEGVPTTFGSPLTGIALSMSATRCR